MNTRLATKADFKHLYPFWQSVGLQLYNYEDELKRYESMLALNPDLCLVLENNDEIIGSIMGTFDGRTASIHRLAVASDFQKHGLGKELIQKLEAILKSQGIKKLSAQIHISNTIVVPFYEKNGFQEMSYVKTYYKDL